MYLLFFLCFILIKKIISSKTNIEFGFSIIDPNKKYYSTEIINYSQQIFTQELLLSDISQSKPINLSNMMIKYDNDLLKNKFTVIGKIQEYFYPVIFSNDLINNILDEFNYLFRNVSNIIENNCIELINDAKIIGIFENYATIDTIEETLEKIQEEVKISNEETEKGIIGSVGAAAVSIVNQDPLSALTYMSISFNNLFDYMTESKVKLNNIHGSNNNKENKLTKSQRIDLENKIFIFSQLYCSMGYNLQIEFINNTIKLLGDKVPYSSMINLLSTIDQNIKMEITKLLNNNHNKDNIIILESLKQRLDVLRSITDYLYNIINFSFELQMSKLNAYPSQNSILELNIYLDNQLSHLYSMINKIQLNFPITNLLLIKKQKLIEDEIKIKMIELSIQDLILNATIIARHRLAYNFARNTEAWFEYSKIISSEYLNIGIKIIYLIKNNIKLYSFGLIGLISEGPFQFINCIMGYLNNFLFSLFFNPSGLLLTIIVFIILEITIGGITKPINFIKNILIFIYNFFINIINFIIK